MPATGGYLRRYSARQRRRAKPPDAVDQLFPAALQHGGYHRDGQRHVRGMGQQPDLVQRTLPAARVASRICLYRRVSDRRHGVVAGFIGCLHVRHAVGAYRRQPCDNVGPAVHGPQPVLVGWEYRVGRCRRVLSVAQWPDPSHAAVDIVQRHAGVDHA